MIRACYIDADALYALHDRSDILYPQAVTLISQLMKDNPTLYLGTNIMFEVLTMLRQRVSKQEAVDLLDDLRSSKYIIIHPDEKIIEHAEMLFRKIASKNTSYSDCVSFAIMKHHHLKWVFSFDEDFKKQGFKRFGFER